MGEDGGGGGEQEKWSRWERKRVRRSRRRNRRRWRSRTGSKRWRRRSRTSGIWFSCAAETGSCVSSWQEVAVGGTPCWNPTVKHG